MKIKSRTKSAALHKNLGKKSSVCNEKFYSFQVSRLHGNHKKEYQIPMTYIIHDSKLALNQAFEFDKR